ncbi:uncharacterized protein LOC133302452 [Gastrolobium bilobum]|uniref:uncharacterized protein LOC133302452 n=1 Tax=Gastrolobium bilobum TaxID=150636 RepID=UPI002AB0C6B3|nr:uncharacterized protein LOC133302452 [Gastrolobium bilobum]
MGKSSASLKRKRSKNSSKAKGSSRSKIKKHKSKKGRRREVSLSSSDYDDSKILISDDSHRRKRDQSRARKDVKGRKKRARRRSSNRDSSVDSLYARKRKKAKRKNENDEVREESHQKKKIRREASANLVGSGSWSCSTCQGGSDSNDDSQYESHRGRTERKEKDKRRLERGRSGSEKSSRYKARSFSCSPRSEHSYEETEVKYIGENNSRWLRSVITVTKEAEESMELCRNETKEEIVDDHDYPCRSNDSNDGATKRELDHHTHTASEEKVRVEDEIGDMNADLNFTEPELGDRSYSDRSDLKAYSAGTSESMKKETSETFGANLNGDDLESILRQRALENLKKFRGEVQSSAKASDQKNKVVSQVKQPITDKHELVQDKSIVNKEAVGTKFDKQTPVEETSLPVGRTNLIAYPRNKESVLNKDKDISGSSKLHFASAPGKVIDADDPSETITESTNLGTSNLELTTPASCHDSLQSHSSLKQTPVAGLPQEKLDVAEITKIKGTFESAHVLSHSSNDNVNNIGGLSSAVPKPSIHGPKFKRNNPSKGQDDIKDHFELKQTSTSHEPPNAKFVVTKGDAERNSAKITQAAIQSINSSGRDVDEFRNSATPESCLESSSVENNAGKLQVESNQGSQFEQKTMNVMRGGEMVEVSYKVYIPKKAPALARRKLKR